MNTSVSQIILDRVKKLFESTEHVVATDANALLTLKEHVLFILQVGHLLDFCEKDTIFGLFQIKSFRELRDAQAIKEVLREKMLDAVKDVYLAAATQIKKKYQPREPKLTEDEQKEITGTYDPSSGTEKPGLADHIVGVFTSLLQMYYAINSDPCGLDPARLQVGSVNVLRELTSIFRRLHLDVDSDDTFRKWAFVSLFHDIAKIEETYSVLKHDVMSAAFIEEHGILEMLSLPSKEEKDEAKVIIGKHVEIGCHGPGDHSISSLRQLFEGGELSRLFVHSRGQNINPDKLERVLLNALLMWTHDAAGTTRKGLATSLPFYYLQEMFDRVLQVAAPMNVKRDMPEIGAGLDRLAGEFMRKRIGRIICAWLNSEAAKDEECSSEFFRAAETAKANNVVSIDDVALFERHFPGISAKNHLLNMLVLPIREVIARPGDDPEAVAVSYQQVVRGFVLITKAVAELRCDDVRAVNKQRKMELNPDRRNEMAIRLAETIEMANDVRLGSGEQTAVFVDQENKPITVSNVEIVKDTDKETKKQVVLIRITVG